MYSHFSLVRTTSGKEKILYHRELLVSENYFKTLNSPCFTLCSNFERGIFFTVENYLFVRFFLFHTGFSLFYGLRRVSGLFWAKKYYGFLFQVHSFVQDVLTRIVHSEVLIEGLSCKRKRKNEERKKKKGTETFCALFCVRKKWLLPMQISRTSDYDSSGIRANSFAAQDESSNNNRGLILRFTGKER